jgi:hypothetical protein
LEVSADLPGFFEGARHEFSSASFFAPKFKHLITNPHQNRQIQVTYLLSPYLWPTFYQKIIDLRKNLKKFHERIDEIKIQSELQSNFRRRLKKYQISQFT